MKCDEILKLLSEYIDRTLDTRSVILVEEHIAICEECRKELEALNSCVKELSSLERVAAPEDFLVKVHQRLELKSGFRKVLEKMFFPLHIKIPMELAGVLAVALFLVYTYKSNLPSPKPEQGQFVKAPISLESRSKVSINDLERERSDKKISREVHKRTSVIKKEEVHIEVKESKHEPEYEVASKAETIQKETIIEEPEKLEVKTVEYAKADIPVEAKTDTIEPPDKKEETLVRTAYVGTKAEQEPPSAFREITTENNKSLELEFYAGEEMAGSELDVVKSLSKEVPVIAASVETVDDQEQAEELRTMIVGEISDDKKADFAEEAVQDLIQVAILIKSVEAPLKVISGTDYQTKGKSSMGLMAERSRPRQSVKRIRLSQSMNWTERTFADEMEVPFEMSKSKAEKAVKPEEKKKLEMPDMNKITSSIKDIIDVLEGKVVKIEYNEQTKKPQFITVEISSINYSPLFNKLSLIGKIKSDKYVKPPKDTLSTRIRIELIPSN